MRRRSLWFCPLDRFNRAVEGYAGATRRCTGTGRSTHASRLRGKGTRGNRSTPKDVKNEATSGDVHENTGPQDNLPDQKDAISAFLHAILQGKAHILPEPSAIL
jgi:hypothetical protein